MATRRIACVVAAVTVAVAALIAAGGASAEARVFNSHVKQDVSGAFFNICDLSQGPDSPMWTGSGTFTEDVHLTQVNDLHYHLMLHSVTQITGTYPDGRHVVFHSVFDSSSEVNLDPSSLVTGDLVLASALTSTSTTHDGIHVQGNGVYPDENADTVNHLTFTPDLKLASLVVDVRGGCSNA
jgi:hypothetical protein